MSYMCVFARAFHALIVSLVFLRVCVFCLCVCRSVCGVCVCLFVLGFFLLFVCLFFVCFF